MLADAPVFYVMALLAALGSALVGGVLMGFSDFIMRALGRIAPEAGVPAMQEINVVVLRSWFLRVFFATALLSVALAVLAVARWQWPHSYLLLAGGLLYLAGPFAVTVFKNVPLNNRLARDGRAAWAEYLVTWTRWNHLRTVAAFAAAALFALAL
jgi:uncharacterized membrane protein